MCPVGSVGSIRSMGPVGSVFRRQLGKMATDTPAVKKLRIRALPESVPYLLRYALIPSAAPGFRHPHLQFFPLGVISHSINMRPAKAKAFPAVSVSLIRFLYVSGFHFASFLL